MNRLGLRLTLAFLAVTVITVATVALFTAARADAEFRRYLEQREEAGEVSGFAAVPGAGRGSGGGPAGRMGQGPPLVRPLRPPEQAFIDQVFGSLGVATVLVGGFGMVLGFAFSRTIAAPLGTLAAAAREYAAGRWERRAPERGAAELVEVARAFNHMADELQRGEALRRSLMADIAHELRTPLTVMQGNLRALLDGIYPLAIHEIATLYDETRLLSRLVADLRELALAESRQLPLHLQSLDLLPVLRAAVESFALAAEAQDIQLQLVAKPLPTVLADPERLAQVMHNLLNNALRHTPGGVITVTAEVAGTHARLSVRDTGEGIPPEELPYIFDRFYRGTETRAGSGIGLGLAIAKAWVEAMGGQIGVEAAAAGGSLFWFTVPLAAPAVSRPA